MRLNEAKKDSAYIVEQVLVREGIGRRLEALGVNEGTKIQVLNRKGSGSIIVKVRGTRLALGRTIAGGIEVRDEGKPPMYGQLQSVRSRKEAFHG